MRLGSLGAAAVAICWAAEAPAQAPAPAPGAEAAATQPSSASPRRQELAGCRFDVLGIGKVAKIVDGRSFFLDDGRQVRLAGIEVPFAPAADEAGAQAEAGRAARSALETLLGGETVELRQNGEIFDRYGRLVAHVYRRDAGTVLSAPEAMLSQGFAQVGSQTGERACTEALLRREREARTARRGLWSDGTFAVRAAASLAALTDIGQFTLAEGKVVSVRETPGTIYVNFGRRWSEALTVTIAKRNERGFVAAGLAPATLASRRVRVRGFLEQRNGPRIEATRPEQIELAERN